MNALSSWPKEIRDKMHSHGIYQCPESGYPIIDSALQVSWAERVQAIEDENKELKNRVEILENNIPVVRY